jgi:hypothetical protein
VLNRTYLSYYTEYFLDSIRQWSLLCNCSNADNHWPAIFNKDKFENHIDRSMEFSVRRSSSATYFAGDV